MNLILLLSIVLLFIIYRSQSQDVVYDEDYQQENIDSNSSVNTIPEVTVFDKLFGSTLYAWKDDEVIEAPTSNFLGKGKTNVIGVYFSASWCGPCKQFTPLLANFYNDMNKKGKKFEIIWASRDRTAEEFVEYFQKMPWLAITIDNLNGKLGSLAQIYQLKGIPHLVIIDGEDGSIFTLDGRTMVLKDKYGLEFPWKPRTLLNLLPKGLKNIITDKMDKTKLSIKNFINGFVQGLAPQKLLQMMAIKMKKLIISLVENIVDKSKAKG